MRGEMVLQEAHQLVVQRVNRGMRVEADMRVRDSRSDSVRMEVG